jgi:hypothetical protein
MQQAHTQITNEGETLLRIPQSRKVIGALEVIIMGSFNRHLIRDNERYAGTIDPWRDSQ